MSACGTCRPTLCLRTIRRPHRTFFFEETTALTVWDDIEHAVTWVRARVPACRPAVGVVLGSGLGGVAGHLDHVTTLPYGDIPAFPITGVQGHAGSLAIGTLAGVECAVMCGRVHYYEGHDMQRVTFPVRVLAALGVRTLVVTNAAGAINTTYQVGDLMLVCDHINLTGTNPLRGPNDERLGPRFPDMSAAYCPRLRAAALAVAQRHALRAHAGVYVGLAGPSYETPAEIEMLRRLGADAVGMSTVAEVIVARHAGLRVVAISGITNRAAGLDLAPLSHDEVMAAAAPLQGAVSTLLCDLMRDLA